MSVLNAIVRARILEEAATDTGADSVDASGTIHLCRSRARCVSRLRVGHGIQVQKLFCARDNMLDIDIVEMDSAEQFRSTVGMVDKELSTYKYIFTMLIFTIQAAMR